MRIFSPGSKVGFTLMEVMAAVMLIAIAMTFLMDLRGQSVGRAANARSISVAARMASQLFHRIEAAMVIDLYDGMSGDFSEEGYAEFSFQIGLGDSSMISSSNDVDVNSPEFAWRQSREQREDDREKEDGDDVKPEKTRVVVIVTYPAFSGDELEYRLEAMVDSWAVFQDFELYRDLWESNNATNKIE